MSRFHKHPLGEFFEGEHFGILFGNRNSSLDQLTAAFPNLKFARIKQIHSDVTVPASLDQLQIADAHYTSQPMTALLISTADCLPIMMFHPQLKTVLSIHAGWRGVANRIVPKALKFVQDKHAITATESWTAFIGPHIQTESFEVENNVRDQLLLSSHRPLESSQAVRALSSEKCCVSLDYLMQSQLLECGLQPAAIHRLSIDTKTSLDYHSHRRDRELSGRNLSFIYLK